MSFNDISMYLKQFSCDMKVRMNLTGRNDIGTAVFVAYIYH